MAKYTTELRSICEMYAGYDEVQGGNKVFDVIEKARPKLFDFEYPIFDLEYKALLETKIIKHFYFKEIGFETAGQFKFFLAMKMNEIMPLYNQYYKSELIKFDPMTDFDYQVSGNKNDSGTKNNSSETTTNSTGTTQRNGTDKGTTDTSNKTTTTTSGKEDQTTNSNTNTTGTKWDYYHDTPQDSIATINDQTYLTNARKLTDNTDVGYQGTANTTRSGNDTEEGTGKETTDRTTTETINDTNNTSGNVSSNEQFRNIGDYAEHHFGKSSGRSFSEFLNDFRATFLNIDMLVINDLEELFMQLW